MNQPTIARAPDNTSKPRQATMGASKKRHVTTMKLSFALITLFLLAYTPAVVHYADILKNAYWLQMSLVNHVGNSAIYFWINKDFRNDVKALVKRPFQRN